jgi:DNA-binding PadR family transcriptional regulator
MHERFSHSRCAPPWGASAIATTTVAASPGRAAGAAARRPRRRPRTPRRAADARLRDDQGDRGADRGLWRPSAGSIYPTLQLLEDEDLIRGEDSDGKRRFSLTEEGRAAAAERSGPLPWDEVTAGADPRELRLRESFLALRAAVLQAARAGSEEQAPGFRS